eukprot:scaffold8.g1363.t1
MEPPAAKRRKKTAGDVKTGVAKFRRGPEVATRKIEDKKLKGRLRYTERLIGEAQAEAARVDEWLLPSEAGLLEAEGMERTWRFKQEEIVKEVEVGAGRKVYDLSLAQLGPYALDFTRNGRHLLLGGRKGHLAMLDWQRQRRVCEVQVRETTHDVAFLHNETFFAAAQKKYVYLYDKRGIEVHCLKDTTEARRLEFLPHHFLLCSVVATHRTRLGPCGVMRQNPWNAVLALGHGNGTVTMWTPNISTPVVRMLAHHGPLRALAVDAPGRHLVTAGADGQARARGGSPVGRGRSAPLESVKVWDVRTFKPLHAYFSPAPAAALDISQRGMLAVGYGRRIQARRAVGRTGVWKDALGGKAQSPYMTHTLAGGALADFAFCPYEDVLAAGHAGGLSTMLIPGAGEPNYDSYVADPFQSLRQRREAEVHALLDKLRPEMIVLDPTAIGQARGSGVAGGAAVVVKEPREVQRERAAEAAAADAAARAAARAKNEEKTRMKGKNRPSRRRRKKQENIIEERKPAVKARMREQGVAAEYGWRHGAAGGGGGDAGGGEAPLEGVPRALHRFHKKG